MKEIDEYIDKLRKVSAEAVEADSKLVGNKALKSLMETIKESIDLLLENQINKDYYDADLGKNISKAVENAIAAFAKVKAPVINVAAVDLKPLQSIAGDIAKGQSNLAGLIEKMNKGDKSDELYRLIIVTNNQVKGFLEKGFEQINYTDQLSKLIEASKRPLLEKLTIVRGDHGKMIATAEYKK